MTLRLFPVLALLCLAACSYAGESVGDVVVSVTIDEIRADSSLIAGKDYVSTGQPDAEILAIAKDAGFATVIDMRMPNENRGFDEAAVSESLGLHYVSLPVSGGGDVTFENAAELDKILSESKGPVLMHCASGNRVGALYALRESLHGAGNDDALAAGKAAGLTRLEGVVKERLENH